MKSKYRKQIADKAEQHLQRMHERHKETISGKTGAEALSSMLGIEVFEPEKEEEPKPQIILYLRDGLKGVESNWTKYPNEIHELMADRLTEYESILYVKLWRESWGYGRNYCRHSYSDTIRETTIKSLSTARRATTGLKRKKFIITALNEDDILMSPKKARYIG